MTRNAEHGEGSGRQRRAALPTKHTTDKPKPNGKAVEVGPEVEGHPGEKWEEFDSSYYVVSARDDKGGRARLFCTCPPYMHLEIEKILASRKFPFRVMGDIVRWAAWKAIKELNALTEVPHSMVNVCEMLVDSGRQSEMWHTFRASLDMTEKVVNDYVQSGNEAEALKLLSKAKADAMKIKEDVWRNMFLDEFTKRFSHIFERNKKKAAKLTGGGGR